MEQLFAAGSPFAQLFPFLVSLGIGLLIGLERERNPRAKAGLRTFALTSLLGTLCAMLSAQTGSLPRTCWPTGRSLRRAIHRVAHLPEPPARGGPALGAGQWARVGAAALKAKFEL